jgi:D-alanyl-D-alanine-carboxypeptidase/D-alanyl-D-alanine-endopeptidase
MHTNDPTLEPSGTTPPRHLPLSLDELTARVQTLTLAETRRHVGVAVGAIAGPHRVTFATGRTSRTMAEPAGADTIFPIGSITKVFTALVLADAVVNDIVTLDTPLAAILPDTPSSGGCPMMLRHLASHTSGLPRLPKGLRRQALRDRANPYRNFSTADLLAALKAARPHPQPGKRVRYSNFGMALLGEALSRQTGVRYDRLVRERIADPLGLADTGVVVPADREQRRARSHSRRGRAVPDWDLGAMPGAGALWSTVNDLLAVLHAHLDPSATSVPEALAMVQQPQATANRWLQVGLGWHRSPLTRTGNHIWWHNGATAGTHSYLAFMPAVKAGVVVLSNTGRPVEALGVHILQALTSSAAA